MVGERNDLKNILLSEVIELFKVVEESFFVSDEIVELQVIMHSFVRDGFSSCGKKIVVEVFEAVGKF